MVERTENLSDMNENEDAESWGIDENEDDYAICPDLEKKISSDMQQ